MKLTFGAFGLTGIEVHAAGDVAGAFEAAIQHYLPAGGWEDLPLGFSAALRFPRSRRLRETRTAAIDVDLAIDEPVKVRLELEARAQGIAFEQLLEHVLFIYLAHLDLHSGRRTGRGGVPEGARAARALARERPPD